MTFGLFLAVAAGGLVGAPARFLLDRAVSGSVESELPWGTFVVNASGSLVLGLLTGLALGGHLGPSLRALLSTGFCGAYTTFSTFTFEAIGRMEDGRYLEAAAISLVSVAVGLAVAAAGLALGLAL